MFMILQNPFPLISAIKEAISWFPRPNIYPQNPQNNKFLLKMGRNSAFLTTLKHYLWVVYGWYTVVTCSSLFFGLDLLNFHAKSMPAYMTVDRHWEHLNIFVDGFCNNRILRAEVRIC